MDNGGGIDPLIKWLCVCQPVERDGFLRGKLHRDHAQLKPVGLAVAGVAAQHVLVTDQARRRIASLLAVALPDVDRGVAGPP